MPIETAKASAHEALEQAWQTLQDTPSYLERFANGNSSFEAEASVLVLTFCGTCGFWVDDQHQCPAQQEVK